MSVGGVGVSWFYCFGGGDGGVFCECVVDCGCGDCGGVGGVCGSCGVVCGVGVGVGGVVVVGVVVGGLVGEFGGMVWGRLRVDVFSN